MNQDEKGTGVPATTRALLMLVGAQDVGSDADRWPRAAVHTGDVVVADYVEDNADEHGHVMAAGASTMVQARSLLALESAMTQDMAQDVAMAQSWRQHCDRLAQAVAEVLAIVACAECGHCGADHRTSHHSSHGQDGCTALADEESLLCGCAGSAPL